MQTNRHAGKRQSSADLKLSQTANGQSSRLATQQDALARGSSAPGTATSSAPADPDFETIKDAWPWLSADDRRRLATMAKEAALQNR